MNRRLFLVFLLLSAPVAPAAAARQDAVAAEDAAPLVEPVPAAVAASVDAGVAYLTSRQRPDGAITPKNQHRLATTALAAMAMLAVGHQPTDDTPEGRAMQAAVDYMLGDEWPTAEGYLGGRDGSRMYGHGIVTLLLSELAGQLGDAERERVLRERLEAAIDLILRSQQAPKYAEHFEGGWRYEPTSGDSDLSITVWQAMALRSAASAGVAVPAAAIEDAVAYLERSYKPEPGEAGASLGRFGYKPDAGGGQRGYSQTAAGLLAMQVCGRYDAPAVLGAADWLLARPLREQDQWFFYGTYYYAQGMYQRGGEHATAARERVEALLPAIQRDDGSWRGNGVADNEVYATSMAILSLSVRYHYLPIYQR